MNRNNIYSRHDFCCESFPISLFSFTSFHLLFSNNKDRPGRRPVCRQYLHHTCQFLGGVCEASAGLEEGLSEEHIGLFLTLSIYKVRAQLIVI